jgi:hypothetical protein
MRHLDETRAVYRDLLRRYIAQWRLEDLMAYLFGRATGTAQDTRLTAEIVVAEAEETLREAHQ